MSWYSDIKIWAQSLESQWSEAHAQGVEFSRFATDAMKDHKFHENFVLEDVIKDLMEASEYPYQVHPMSAFGEPPITLHFAKDETFYLDLYIWMTASTSIHQHSFEGAFSVLQGTSLESDYEFKADHALGTSLMGRLEKKAIRKIVPGEIRTIHPREKMVHRVLHLSKPTVSLVLRSHVKVKGVVQHNYDFDVLASNGHPPLEIMGKLRVLKWYLKNGYVPTFKMVEPLIPYADLWNLLANNQQGHGLLKKIAYLHSENEILVGMSRQHLFHNLFMELHTEEEKILFTALEFFGESWTDWVQKNLHMDSDQAKEKLKAILEKLPSFEESAKSSPLLKVLY